MDFSEILQQISDWMENFAHQYGYFGIFLISFLGATSIIFPIPYTVIIFTLGYTFEPLFIAIAAGLGSALGEFTGYLVGIAGQKILSKKYGKRTKSLIRVIEKYGWIYIFIFALTPLPDDLLFIPLGIMRYGWLKAFIPALMGKFCMSLIVAYSGRFSLQLIKEVFGIENTWITLTIGIILGFTLLILTFILVSKTKLEERLETFRKNNEKVGESYNEKTE